MEKQKNFKIGLYSLIAIVLIILFSLLSFLAYEAVLLNKNLEKANAAKDVKTTPVPVKEDEVIEEDFTDVPEEIVVDEPTSTVEPTQEVDESTITDLFSQYLESYKSEDKQESARITDYTVTSVHILTGSEKDTWLTLDNGQYYKSSDTLAHVTFDLKPLDINNCMDWLAGKEPAVDGEWLRGKSLCVYVSDGVLKVAGTSF